MNVINQKAEVKKLRTRVVQKFREGVKTFELVAPGDHILIGLSGGKDSLTLLDLMGKCVGEAMADLHCTPCT